MKLQIFFSCLHSWQGWQHWLWRFNWRAMRPRFTGDRLGVSESFAWSWMCLPLLWLTGKLLYIVSGNGHVWLRFFKLFDSRHPQTQTTPWLKWKREHPVFDDFMTHLGGGPLNQWLRGLVDEFYLTVGLPAVNHKMSTYPSKIITGTVTVALQLFNYSLPMEQFDILSLCSSSWGETSLYLQI